LRAILRETSRALVFDPIGNFRPGLVVTSQAELVDYLHRVQHLPFRILYRPRCEVTDREVLAWEANFLCRSSRVFPGVSLFLDEIDTFADCDSMPPELSALITYGRNITVTIHAAVRRPKTVIPRHYVTETTQMSVFHLVDAEDCKFVESFTHLDQAELERLPELEFWRWSDCIAEPSAPALAKFRLRQGNDGATIEAASDSPPLKQDI
jgi:hypothetical protein